MAMGIVRKKQKRYFSLTVLTPFLEREPSNPSKKLLGPTERLILSPGVKFLSFWVEHESNRDVSVDTIYISIKTAKKQERGCNVMLHQKLDIWSSN